MGSRIKRVPLGRAVVSCVAAADKETQAWRLKEASAGLPLWWQQSHRGD